MSSQQGEALPIGVCITGTPDVDAETARGAIREVVKLARRFGYHVVASRGYEHWAIISEACRELDVVGVWHSDPGCQRYSDPVDRILTDADQESVYKVFVLADPAFDLTAMNERVKKEDARFKRMDFFVLQGEADE